MTSPFSDQLAALRPTLLRVARRQVRNEVWAEDAVSETLLAALEKPLAFEGRAQLQTWLIGVLKHKLVDQMRRYTREQAFAGDGEEGGAAPQGPTLADMPTPGMWGDPQAHLQQRQFMLQCQSLLQHLPAQQGMAFVLRDWLECETDEICKELGITATNLSVMLYRARRRMRDVLQPQYRPSPMA